MTAKMTAVEVRGAYKFYGRESSSNKQIILNKFNMTVDAGSIYGLLGSSGCGKTTLLSCVVGLRKLNSGQITVLGHQVGSAGYEAQGPRIGYMPQETALIKEFTIRESFYFFGRIYDMSERKIKDKLNMFTQLLNLPDKGRYIKDCSGGQQRRVSFAIVMLHDPELLILDEPTVGMDPLLREKIWNFLVESTVRNNTAVIITTHYIEEASGSNRVGLMRNGILLAEDTPRNILERFESESLEEAFLQVCLKKGKSEDDDENEQGSRDQPPTDVESENLSYLYNGVTERTISYHESFRSKLKFTTKKRMRALITKNVLQFIRQPSGLIFYLMLPIIQLTTCYFGVGGNPRDLKLGVVNYEMPNLEDCLDKSLVIVTFPNNSDICELHTLSCRFLQEFNSSIADLEYYETTKKADSAVSAADIIGYIYFSANFTESFTSFQSAVSIATGDIINAATINIILGVTDYQTKLFLENKIHKTYFDFIDNLNKDCNSLAEFGTSPVVLQDPIFGKSDGEVKDSMMPGLILIMTFSITMLSTSTIFVTEKSDGIWNRVLISGVKIHEFLLSHLITQFVLVIIESLQLIYYGIYIFDVDNNGSDALALLLTVLSGLLGICLGLLISISVDSTTASNPLVTGVLLMNILLTGCFWPLQGMPDALRYIAYIFPTTIPLSAINDIFFKGWSLANEEVAFGFGVIIIWTIAGIILCWLGLKRMSR